MPALMRTIFAQLDVDAAHRRLREIATGLERNYSKAAGVLADTEDEVTDHVVFPRHHWREIWSSNPLERLNKEIKRRTNAVGASANDDALLRLDLSGRSWPGSSKNGTHLNATTSPSPSRRCSSLSCQSRSRSKLPNKQNVVEGSTGTDY